MSDRGPGSRRASIARVRNSSRSATSSARSSAAFERDHDQHQHLQLHNQPSLHRYNPSLRSVGSCASLSDQFATTRREYEFGFDDGASFITADADTDADADEDTDHDDTLMGSGSFDGVIVTLPASQCGGDDAPRQPRATRIRRSHYELLSVPPGKEACDRDIRSAYFRLRDILCSDSIPPQHRDLAEWYFGHVQAAFETLIGKHSRDDYNAAVLEDELEQDTSTPSDQEGDDDVDSVVGQAGRANTRLVHELRRQQDRGITEIGLQMDVQQFLITPTKRHRTFQRAIPATLSLRQTSSTSFPAISQFVQPKLRQIRKILGGAASPGGVEDEIYCTAPGLTFTSSICATDLTTSLFPPTSVLARQKNLNPDTVPRDRQLQWYSVHFAPALNIKLRQEIFIRKPGLSEAALKRTLPDAVVELETDTLNAASVTARASQVLRFTGDEEDGAPAEPLHAEISASASRVWPAASCRPRFGLALHRRAGPRNGGAVFACAHSGAPPPWGSLPPPSLSNGPARKRPGLDPTAASWRSYMDQLSHVFVQGAVPNCYSPPTLEVGYKFGGCAEDSLGLRSGCAFTKPADGGLQRLHDNTGLGGPDKGWSWTVSGALSTGGVAAYLRLGRDLLSPHAGLGDSLVRGRLRRMLGCRFEAELSIQNPRPGNLLGRVRSLGWPAQTSQLAVRGLKRFGRSSRIGLELSVNSTSSSLVLSLYYSQGNSRRLVLPLVLFRDQPSHHDITKALLWAGLLSSLALAALDHSPAYLQPPAAAAAAEEERKGRRSQDMQVHIATRRAEADDLAAILAETVSRRQRAQRERGGLVILSAKYGVRRGPGWTSSEEVADVTVAVAALVGDDGALHVPAGLRKSKLLGFWDPSPRRTKCLLVRYMYRGQEGVKEVMGRDELTLP